MTGTELATNNNDNAMLSYQEASTRFRIAYQHYREYRETVILETRTMFGALKLAGYTNKAAINKIAEDHIDLKGFSERSIYRNLPAEIKNPLQRNRRLGYQNPVAKNTEFGNQKGTEGEFVIEEHNFNTEGMGVTITYNEDNDTTINKIDLLQREIAALKKENAALKKKVEEYERLPNNDALYNRIDLLKKELVEVKNENEFLKSSLVEQAPNIE